MRYYIYRYMADDQWVYVGKSAGALLSRIMSHAYEPKFQPYSNAIIEYFECNSQSDMDLTEKLLIKTMHPILNVLDSTDGSIPFRYDDTLISWKKIDETKGNLKLEEDLSIPLDTVVEWFRQVKGNEKYIIYSGPIYGTYKIPFADACIALNINEAITLSSLTSRLKYVFDHYSNAFGARIICKNDYRERMLYLYEYR